MVRISAVEQGVREASEVQASEVRRGGRNSPSQQAGRMCGKRFESCVPPIPSPPQLLPLTLLSFLQRGVWSCPTWSVCCLWVRGGMRAQPALTRTPYTSPESLARMEAVVNLYQEVMKYSGKMLSSLLLQNP